MNKTNNSTNITCPHCKEAFSAEDALIQHLQADFEQKRLQLEAESERKLQKMLQDKEKDLENKLKMETQHKTEALQKALDEKNAQLNSFKTIETTLIETKNKLKEFEASRDIDVKKGVLVAQKQWETQKTQQIKEQYALEIQQTKQDYDVTIKEKDVLLEQLQKRIKDLNQKSQQGSMQLQGEAQELVIEEKLRTLYPFDEIKEIDKGANGADTLQIIHNKHGQECGKILYESKRTKTFSNAYIAKLKKDMQQAGVQVGILVTNTMPKDMPKMGEKQGVWICRPSDFPLLSMVLRKTVLEKFTFLQSQTNKKEKMGLLYDYLTGKDFKLQIASIFAVHDTMLQQIIVEKRAFDKQWKAREKNLNLLVLSAGQIQGSIEGISGQVIVEDAFFSDVEDIPVIEEVID